MGEQTISGQQKPRAADRKCSRRQLSSVMDNASNSRSLRAHEGRWDALRDCAAHASAGPLVDNDTTHEVTHASSASFCTGLVTHARHWSIAAPTWSPLMYMVSARC